MFVLLNMVILMPALLTSFLLFEVYAATLQAPNNDISTRMKRQSQVKNLELLLAVDNSVVDFHGQDNYKTYVLTMIHIMNASYHHESFGVSINVVLSRIQVFNKNQARDFLQGGNIRRGLQKFCRWSENRHRIGRERYDVAVYLTRTKIGPAGYAPITGMCRPHRSCAIIHDEGLSSAFVMAHEVAHIFGLQHNGHGNYCGGPKYAMTIMAAMVTSNFHNYSWSPCSKLHMSYVMPYMTCLNDQPVIRKWPAVPQPLGSGWSMQEQCRQEFGVGHNVCKVVNTNTQCERLWCSQLSDPLLCKTKKGPPLEGTKCGHQMICVKGRCEYKAGVTAVNGNWSAWSAWGQCSTPCNRGVRFRHRKCNKPRPQFGGKECIGAGLAYTTCNTDLPCQQYRDFRAELCDKLRSTASSNSIWRPYQMTNVNDNCVVACIREDVYKAVVTQTHVTYGTPCTYELPDSLCINGICLKHDCDGRLNSTKKRDLCGVCRGDNSTCRLVKGRYSTGDATKTGTFESVVLLPPGVWNVVIREEAATPQTLAIYDAVNNQYYKNSGDGSRESEQQLVIAGARFEYRQSRHVDQIISSGPLYDSVLIQVYIVDSRRKASISYQYYEVMKSDPMTSPVRVDNVTGGSLSFNTTESVQHNSSGFEVVSIVSQQTQRFTPQQTQRFTPQQTQRFTSPHPETSKHTRSTNTSTKMIHSTLQGTRNFEHSTFKTPVKQYQPITSTTVSNNHNSTQPKHQRFKSVSPNFTQTEIQTTSVIGLETTNSPPQQKPTGRTSKQQPIKPGYNSTSTLTSPHQRTQSTPPTLHPTTTIYSRSHKTKIKSTFKQYSLQSTAKPTYSMEHEDVEAHMIETNQVTHPPLRSELTLRSWTRCSSTCGSGVQRALYSCLDSDSGQPLPGEACTHLYAHNSSSDVRQCDLQSCELYKWFSGKWGSCVCGRAPFKRRSVRCRIVEKNGGAGKVVRGSMCKSNTQPKPKVPCGVGVACMGKWRLTPWSKCSVTCGEGTQTRRAVCRHNPPDTCEARRPITTRPCNKPTCLRTPVKVCTTGDTSKFCSWATNRRNCANAGYYKMCCVSCHRYNLNN